MNRIIFPERYPLALQHVVTAVYEYLTAHKVTDHLRATEAAFAAAENVRKQIGGAASYIGKGAYFEADLRAQEIYERFNGRNGPELAREYKLTEERIRQICVERMKADRARRQGNLPGL